ELAQDSIVPTPPKLIPIIWRITADTDLLYDKSDKLAYARIKIGPYVHSNDICTKGLDLSIFKDAIVIVGSTHQWSDDVHSTPVGDLPGSVIQANLGLELQSPP